MKATTLPQNTHRISWNINEQKGTHTSSFACFIGSAFPWMAEDINIIVSLGAFFKNACLYQLILWKSVSSCVKPLQAETEKWHNNFFNQCMQDQSCYKGMTGGINVPRPWLTRHITASTITLIKTVPVKTS